MVVLIEGKYQHTPIGHRYEDMVVLAIRCYRVTELDGGDVKKPVHGRVLIAAFLKLLRVLRRAALREKLAFLDQLYDGSVACHYTAAGG